MKNRLFLLIAFTLTVLNLNAQTYQKTDGGMQASTQSTNISIKFYSDGIVRVTKSAEGSVFQKTSRSVIKTPESVQLNYQQNCQIASVSNQKLKV